MPWSGRRWRRWRRRRWRRWPTSEAEAEAGADDPLCDRVRDRRGHNRGATTRRNAAAEIHRAIARYRLARTKSQGVRSELGHRQRSEAGPSWTAGAAKDRPDAAALRSLRPAARLRKAPQRAPAQQGSGHSRLGEGARGRSALPAIRKLQAGGTPGQEPDSRCVGHLRRNATSGTTT